MANIKHMTATEKEMGVIYALIETILNVTRIFIENGTSVPKIISSDCFEKKPEFFMEKRIKKYNPTMMQA